MVVRRAGTAGAGVRPIAAAPDLWPARFGAHAPDYTDAFLAPRDDGDNEPAETAMRAILEGAPPAMRWFVRFGWRFVLGFRPSGSPSILGWAVVESTEDWVVLEQRSALFAAALLLRRTPDGLTWATRVRYLRRGSAALWGLVGLLHRRIVPYVLGRAALIAVKG